MTKPEVAHKWAGWLHNPCHLGGPQRFRAGDKIRIRVSSTEDLIPLGPLVRTLRCDHMESVRGKPPPPPPRSRYNALLLLLGMVQHMQLDGIWHSNGLLSYNPYLAILTGTQHYDVHKYCHPDVGDIDEGCTVQWASAWTSTTVYETLVPHTGPCAGPSKMYIAP